MMIRSNGNQEPSRRHKWGLTLANVIRWLSILTFVVGTVCLFVYLSGRDPVRVNCEVREWEEVYISAKAEAGFAAKGIGHNYHFYMQSIALDLDMDRLGVGNNSILKIVLNKARIVIYDSSNLDRGSCEFVMQGGQPLPVWKDGNGSEFPLGELEELYSSEKVEDVVVTPLAFFIPQFCDLQFGEAHMYRLDSYSSEFEVDNYMSDKYGILLRTRRRELNEKPYNTLTIYPSDLSNSLLLCLRRPYEVETASGLELQAQAGAQCSYVLYATWDLPTLDRQPLCTAETFGMLSRGDRVLDEVTVLIGPGDTIEAIGVQAEGLFIDRLFIKGGRGGHLRAGTEYYDLKGDQVDVKAVQVPDRSGGCCPVPLEEPGLNVSVRASDVALNEDDLVESRWSTFPVSIMFTLLGTFILRLLEDFLKGTWGKV